MAASSRNALGLLLTVLVFVPPQYAPADGSQDVGLIGNEQILWVYRGLVDREGRNLVQFTYRTADSPAGARLFPQRIGPVTGRVACATARGPHLHVFFGDSTHWRYTPGMPLSSIFAPPSRSSELALIPGKSVLPSAIAADDSRDCLYAVVTARDAAEIDARHADDDAGRPGSPEIRGADVIVAHREPPTNRVIARYEQGVWASDRSAPLELAIDGRILQMFAADGVIHVVHRAGSDPSPWLHQRSAGPDEEWTAPVTLPLSVAPIDAAGGWAAGAPVLLVAQRDDGGATVRSLRPGRDGWQIGAELVNEAGRPARFTEPMVVALFHGDVMVATLDQDERIQVGRWSLDQGTPLEPLADVPSLAGAAPSPGDSGYAPRLVLQYSVLAAALAAVFIWRRDSVVRRTELLPGQSFARLSRRALALAVDLVIVAPLWVSVVYAMMAGQANHGLAGWEQAALGIRSGAPVAFWAWALLGAILGLYAMVFEAIIQATPGKRAVRLFVVCEGGRRCGLGAIVVRNLVRVIEFHFVPVALLVAMTANRQRLGDLLARTVVVEPADEPPPESTDDSADPEV